MSKKSFNLIDWFNQKVREEKPTIDYLSDKLKKFTDEIKSQLVELKDDSHILVPVINGLYGDVMEQKGHPALIKMAFRHESRDIESEEMNDHFNPELHQGKLIIFIHGLMNDETIWQSDEKDSVTRLGTFIEKQNKAKVLYIRYNTGRHISENGRELSYLIQNLVNRYLTKISEITIIAHSMGGLVSRSAGHYAQIMGHHWIAKLKNVFLIGVPNDGSYLARIAYMTQYFLRKMDPSKNDDYARLFEIRSHGIKDLSFGFLVDEDWKNPKYENEKEIRATKIYPLKNVHYYLIAATVASEKHKHTVFTFFGDGLVEKESALSSLFKEDIIDQGYIHYAYFAEENHLTLLESTKVQDYILKNFQWK